MLETNRTTGRIASHILGPTAPMPAWLTPSHSAYANINENNMTLNSDSDRSDSVKAEGERIDEVDVRENACLLSDEERLQMLGYDAVLGRPLGFWSSSAMNVCHNSFIFEFISYTSLYGYSAPLVFVSQLDGFWRMW